MKTKFCVLPSLSSTHTHTGGRHQSTALPSFTVFTVSLDSNDLKKKNGFHRMNIPSFGFFYFSQCRSLLISFDGVSFQSVFLVLLPSFTEFYRVLPSFIGFYRVLPSFIGFYLVLLGFT